MAKAYGKLLFDRGLVKSAEPQGVLGKEAEQLGLVVPPQAVELPPHAPPYMTVGGNSRSRAVKLRKLGWSPTRPDVFQTLQGDVDLVAKEQVSK